MKTIQFKITLLSDVILNVKSASIGCQSTLDFIPGNVFLGICAKTLYDENKSETHTIFHSGKVRFGDAHLGCNGVRGVKVPAVMHYPKLSEMKGDICLSHLISDFSAVADKQLKQCRNGFYVFEGEKGMKIRLNRNFSIKSAHDRKTRTSKDGEMYGYESLEKGAEMYFSVEVDDDSLSGKIENALVGMQRIGRSRTAQYGLVQIKACKYSEPQSYHDNVNEITVYADGRLIFFDEETLLPTIRPTAKQLGFEGCEIVWSKSQVRYFQYAPWNFKRQCFDSDRCGIEKGSVIVLRTDGTSYSNKNYVGNYNNEGFGKILINPSFLKPRLGSEYISQFTLTEIQQNISNNVPVDNARIESSQLIRYLECVRKQREMEHGIYAKVNNFVEHKAGIFAGSEAFASQWGTIRSIALGVEDSKILVDEIDKYLSHGIAKDKWEENLRKNVLMDFITNLAEEDDVRYAIINLASEMQKKQRQ